MGCRGRFWHACRRSGSAAVLVVGAGQEQEALSRPQCTGCRAEVSEGLRDRQVTGQPWRNGSSVRTKTCPRSLIVFSVVRNGKQASCLPAGEQRLCSGALLGKEREPMIKTGSIPAKPPMAVS